MRLPVAILLVACGAGYTQTPVRGPVVGLVYDAGSHSIRPINGILGAAMLGNPLVSGLDWADVAPNGKSAIAFASGQLQFISGLDGNPTRVSVAQMGSCCDLSGWSPDSTAVALYTGASRQLAVVSGLNGSATVSRTDLSAFTGAVTFVLIDSEVRVFLGIEGNGSGVYMLDRNGLPRLVARLDHPHTGGLLGARTAIADAGTHKLFELRAGRGSDGVNLIADLSDNANDPVGLGSWSSRFFVADRSSNSVLVFDQASGQLMATLPVDIPPTGMKPLAPGSLFLLGGGGTGPFYILDARGAGTIYFVPAGGGQ